MKTFVLKAAIVAVLGTGLIGSNAFADDLKYPEDTVKIVVPFGAGNVLDVVTRQLGEKLSSILGQTFVVENKTGASGIIGYSAVAQAKPDGYTIGATMAAFAINRYLFKNIPYDEVEDFVPVSTISRTPMVLVTGAKSGMKTLADFRRIVGENPGKYTFAATSAGQQMNSTLVNQRLGLDLAVVNYPDFSKGMTDVIAGRVLTILSPANSAAPLIASGELVALAVLSKDRSSVLKDIPTAGESGIEGIDMWSWQGVLAPANTPQPIVAKLGTTIHGVVKSPDFSEKLTLQGYEPYLLSSDDFAALIKRELKAYAALAAELKIEPK